MTAKTAERTLVLDHDAVQRKLQRITDQLVEENHREKTLVLVGIAPRGFELAERFAKLLEKAGVFKVEVLKLTLDKDDPLSKPLVMSAPVSKLEGKTVVLVDDVLQSGRTLMHAAAYLLQVKLSKLCTVVLVDRLHRKFPIRADIVGMTLSTTMQEHITVRLGKQDAVHLD